MCIFIKYTVILYLFITMSYIAAGSLIHTQSPRGKNAYVFIDTYQWPHDSNLTGNILLQLLERNTPLPPTLYLQLDNCFRENKNRFIFGLCAILITLRIFKKVSTVYTYTAFAKNSYDYYVCTNTANMIA